MKLLKRLLAGVAALLALGTLVLALVLSHTADCEPAPPVAKGAPAGLGMMAIRYRCYGPPQVLALETVPRPAPAAGEVLVRVHAASLNPLDWHYMRGEPYVMRLDSGIGRPLDWRLGVDFAGVVEAVGPSVTRFRPGDAVFGGADGALAEYLTVREGGAVVLKPGNVGFAEAAAVPIAGVTALQALRDRAGVEPGQKVLVNGGSGGVGSYAIQIAKALGAEVTGVASTRNQELMRSLGADQVIDYTRTDFTQGTQRYDVIVDNVGNHSPLALRRVLAPRGVVVTVGSAAKGPWLGMFVNPLKALLVDPFVDQRFETMLASMNPQDLEAMATMLASGRVRSLIDRRYPLAEAPAGIAYLEGGRARGKVVVDVLAADRSLP
jgi:NADPH:quinone reductase-like Zn-dependent oxidoreductase